MHLYLLLEVDGQEARPEPPRVAPGPEGEGAFAPVRWKARYVTCKDVFTGEPAVVVFTDLDQAVWYAGRLLAWSRSDVAVIVATDSEIRDRAFGGDPEGACIVDPGIGRPPWISVPVGRLGEWARAEEQARG
ncbi:MAG: hypothetical protein CYG60_05240 [Actinobacteria bacterium]|nr:MAG: hypothetical protein CYG60_05240 [Actinomycetota bacterium]